MTQTYYFILTIPCGWGPMGRDRKLHTNANWWSWLAITLSKIVFFLFFLNFLLNYKDILCIWPEIWCQFLVLDNVLQTHFSRRREIQAPQKYEKMCQMWKEILKSPICACLTLCSIHVFFFSFFFFTFYLIDLKKKRKNFFKCLSLYDTYSYIWSACIACVFIWNTTPLPSTLH